MSLLDERAQMRDECAGFIRIESLLHGLSSFAYLSHDDLQSPGKGRLFSGHKVAFGFGSIQATCHTSRFRDTLIARHIGKLMNRDRARHRYAIPY